MLKSIRSILMIGVLAFLAGCTKVPAGNVGVKFDLYGGEKGVTGEVVGPGKYLLGWNEEIYLFPTFSQNWVWTADKREGSPNDDSFTFQDSQGTNINVDVGISYSVDGAKADKVFQKYRKGLDEITNIYLRNMVRDAFVREASKMEVTDIYGPKKSQLIDAVTKTVAEQVKDIGINVEKIYLIGTMRLPPSITEAINSKIKSTQIAMQRENELQTAKAQAEIDREKARGAADAKLIEAKSQAEANRILAASVTQTLVDYKAVEVWDGKLPQVSGGHTPFINLQK